MTTFKAHFDGKVLVPDEPVDLPVDCALTVRVEVMEPTEAKTGSLESLVELAKQFPVTSWPANSDDPPLMKLAKALEAIPANPDWPTDGAAQHDHYLYGLPKRP